MSEWLAAPCGHGLTHPSWCGPWLDWGLAIGREAAAAERARLRAAWEDMKRRRGSEMHDYAGAIAGADALLAEPQT